MLRNILPAFGHASRIVLVYPLPEALLISLLKAIGWDWCYLTTFVTLCVYVQVVCTEDRETLDEDIERIVVRVTTQIGYYLLANFLLRHFHDKPVISQGHNHNSYLLHLSLFLNQYLQCVFSMAFFRICIHSLVLSIFLLLKLLTHFAI